MMGSENNKRKYFAGSFLVNQLQISLVPAGGQEQEVVNDNTSIWGTFVGKGAFGQVFVNDDDSLAYKISKSSPDNDERLKKEVARLKAIDQWHDIPKEKLPELSKFEGRSIIAMETLPVLGVRRDSKQYLDFLIINKQYKNSQIFRVLILIFMSHMSDLINQITSAMKFAHDKSIIHGDLKSENILLSISHEGGLQAMVCDWGSGNAKTGEYYFDYDPKSHLESNVTCNDIIKAQDVYAFIRTLKVDCFINTYGLLKGSIRKVLPSSFLLKNLLEIDDVKKMVELAFHNGIPRKLGTFNDLIQSIKKLNSIDKENMSSTLGRIEELLTTQLQMLDSEVVRKEWLTLAEYYWRIKADLDPESLNHAVQGVSEWLVESDKNAYVVGVKQSIEGYQSNLTFSFFSCFRGKIGRERADRLQQVIANLKTVPGVQKAVENTYKSYRGFLPGSLKSFLTNHQSSSQSAVSSCSYN